MQVRERLARWSRGFAVALTLAAAVAAGGQAEAQLAPGEPSDQLLLSNWFILTVGVTDVAFVSDGRGIITMKTGEVVVALPDGTPQKRNAFNFTVDSASEKGLLGVVRDEDDNLYFFASTGVTTTDKHAVYKGRVAVDGTVTVDLLHPVVSGGLEGPANHDGGGMVIYNHQLYIGVGDTGLNATPPQNMTGECLNKANGKILRVNLDGSVPADNPLVDVPLVTGCATPMGGTYTLLPPDKRIFAWGLRNPWRIWMDAATALLWIGDVGEVTEEEITLGGKGVNHGWPFNEGNVKYDRQLGGLSDCKQMTPSTECTPPQYSYPHNAAAASVTGGLIPPKGCGWGAYENRYFFSDYDTSRLSTLDVASDRRSVIPNSRRELGGTPTVVSFRMGFGGAMYLVSNDNAAIFKIVPKSVPASCTRPPSTNGVSAGLPDAAAPDAPLDTPASDGGNGLDATDDELATSDGGLGAEANPAHDAPDRGVEAGRGDAGDAGGRDAVSGDGAGSAVDDGGCSCDLSRRGPRVPGASIGLVAASAALWLLRRRGSSVVR